MDIGIFQLLPRGRAEPPFARPRRPQLRRGKPQYSGAGRSGGGEDQTGDPNTTPAEQAAPGRLLANWRAFVPETLFTK
jgi:hypothetical protein